MEEGFIVKLNEKLDISIAHQSSGKVLHRHVLIVGGGSDLMPRLRSVDPNLHTSVICRASVLKFVYEIECNRTVIVLNDDTPVELWVQHARNLHEVDPIDAVVSFAEIDQDKAAAISEHLGLGYHSPSTISWVHDKLLMRQRLRAAGVEEINNALVYSPDDVLIYGEQWGYPLILKPSKGRASTGISVVHTPKDVITAFNRSSTATAPRLEPSPLIVEPLLQGREYSVETLSEDGQHIILAIVEKYKDDVSKVEVGHLVPAPLSPEIAEQIEDYVARVLDALDIRFGITHTELMVTADGPRIIETHVRPAGDEIPSLIHDSLGVDPLQYFVEQAAGLPIADRLRAHLAKAKPHQRAAAIWYAHTNVQGTLVEINGVEDTKAAPGVQEFLLLLKEGAHLTGLSSSYSRIAFVRTVAAQPEEALQLAQDAIARLDFRISIRSSNWR